MNTPVPVSPELAASLTDAFRRVYDPEFGVSVQDLGLIYDLTVDESGVIVVTMTLTSMYCPAGDVITAGIKSAAEAVPGVASARVDLVWDPVWTPELLSPSARAELGWDAARVNE